MFLDTGLGSKASLTAAIWSEVGRFARGESKRGLTTGWATTGSGVVKDDPSGVSFAMGAEPQILAPEQRGPKGNLSEPLADRAQRVADEAGVDVDVDMDSAEGAAQKAKATAEEAVRQAKGFKARIDAKKEAELHSDGWKSSAFDS